MKNPPSNREVEQMVLGSILLDEHLMSEVIDELESKDFYEREHQEIFKAMAYLWQSNTHITVTNVLDRLDTKKSIVTEDYIFDLTDTMASAANFTHYIKQLKELSEKRELYEVSKYLLTEEIKGVSSEELVRKILKTVDGFTTSSNIELVDVKSFSREWLEEFGKPLNKDNIKFGFKMLDDLIMIEPSNLGIIGARPGYYCSRAL